MQYARAVSRRRAAATYGSFGTHKRTTCGARMQRDMPLPRPLRNIPGAARGRPLPCRAMLVGPKKAASKPHTTAAAEKNAAAKNSP